MYVPLRNSVVASIVPVYGWEFSLSTFLAARWGPARVGIVGLVGLALDFLLLSGLRPTLGRGIFHG